ncbi:MAG: hypothetical protein KHZ15_14490 [Coprobacillus cateniformis]|uniref:hypothetical protein n=1 Tax=Longibaculum muris TaxID=1796628 RepID=UPI003AB10E7E|nr:hypothetical protein [Coprobacillus cateniformis]
MGIFNNNKLDILKKTQENLEITQKNNELLANVLNQLITPANENNEIISEDEKFKAAYALNLCTISVSQIIDYNDLRTLENEYDAILNNLNLENIPKDEALLRILKQLLDTITFFKIEEGEKKILEREYQSKVKNAIWNAVPNFGLIVAGGNPVTMAISLASQVGIGYMNYRKEKAQIDLEKERKKWEMQRSAIEQFNGLRKELFDTAWRLADKYEFKDEYRITERQIAQFNQILLDENDLRRYERLKYIEDNFRAYPPFYYYLGNAANAVYQDESYSIDLRNEYRCIAFNAFDSFLNKTNSNILREDQLEASCALELFELYADKQVEHLDLLKRAIKASGGAFDVIEICAINYLKNGESDQAIDLFRMLVNENYNIDLNAKLLSKLYVSKYIDGDNKIRDYYKELECRCEYIQLFPFPDLIKSSDELEREYTEGLRKDLKSNYEDSLELFIKKFENTYYSILNQNGVVSNDIVNLFNEMIQKIKLLGNDEYNVFSTKLSVIIEELNTNNQMIKMLESPDGGGNRKDLISFDKIMAEPLNLLVNVAHEEIKKANNISAISQIESNLNKFCIENDIFEKISVLPQSREQKQMDFGLLNKEKNELIEKCMKILHKEKYQKQCLIKSDTKKIEFLIRNEYDFNRYFNRNDGMKLKGTPIAVLNDKSISNNDLIFTTKGIIFVKSVIKRKRADDIIAYDDIEVGKSKEMILMGNKEYKEKRIDINLLLDLIKELTNAVKETPNPDWCQSIINKI